MKSFSEWLDHGLELGEKAFSENYSHPFLLLDLYYDQSLLNPGLLGSEGSTIRIKDPDAWAAKQINSGHTHVQLRPRPDTLVTPLVRRDGELGSVTLGRDNEADVLLDNDRVSGIHSEIRPLPESNGRRWEIEDLGSSNGTYLGGVRLESKVAYPLIDGANLIIGASYMGCFFGSLSFFRYLELVKLMGY